MFGGQFLESKELTATVEEMDGVVSERSFEALFQWLYLHVVKFGIEDPTEHISASMELVRLADKYRIVELEDEMAQYIKDIMIITPTWGRHFDTNTHYLTSEHVISAAVLHREHPVRRLFAAASVEGYLRSEYHKFADLYEDCPCFAADLLREVRMALNGVKPSKYTEFKDPVSGTMIEVNQDHD
ncbi:uncharacterized protein N7503_010720 [Penicillium pulvis]|uniref:uncharacterized protein n=1 Tax=Penicillium pulvis TaxID=1562058 RepID=UPI0025492FE5|nr:uncharacterized protein N7503_010720 [Penicillium pulvis]KAJ5785508.1 hypothetical protein N7503_010720 [Penicillium pulvis]